MSRTIRSRRWAVITLFSCRLYHAGAGTLDGTFTSIPQFSEVNLTADGALDWVHWGLNTDTSVTRKAGVTNQISDFSVVGKGGFVRAYQFADNFNGYSWVDGAPTATVSNTTTGVYVVGLLNGFEFTVPASTTQRTLKVYVGAFGAQGELVASLSDHSAPDFTGTNEVNLGNGPSAVYTLTYAANSAGATLTVRYTVSQMLAQPDGNVTLQAAALTEPGANNPPIVSITTPAENATFAAPAEVNLTASAYDFDGTISKVEFLEGTNKFGEALTSPYRVTWTNPPPHNYTLTARATDNGGASSLSVPVEIFVNGGGGLLTGALTMPPLMTIDLTSEGSEDWAHWGLTNADSFDQKAGVLQKISNFSALGTHAVQQYSINYTAFDWSDGTPTPETVGTTTGVFITGRTNGFELSVPADTTPRQLKLYVGGYGAQGNFQAFLSDASARAFTDTSLSNVFGNIYALYTLNYAAASGGQALTIRYRTLALFDFDFGNVTLQAATLQGGNGLVILNPSRTGTDISFTIATEANRAYSVQYTTSLYPANWQTLTNFTGDGTLATVTDQTTSGAQRFYRVEAQ